MKPTLLLFHVENVNDNKDSVCHLILVPVINGEQQQVKEFFFNPQAPFRLVMSGITSEQVDSFPTYAEQWSQVQSIIDKFDITVCSAEGYSAHALYGTLSRLGVKFNAFKYCNAKAICRRSMNELSYCFDFLNFKLFGDCIFDDDPVAIAQRWCSFVLKGLETVDDNNIFDFLSRVKIDVGSISPDIFTPSRCIKDYSKRNKFDESAIPVDANPEHPLFGMNVVFTGKLESMTRNEARAAVVRIGGNAPDSLRQDTDYLVVGVQDIRVVGDKGLSGKMKSAAKFNEKGCSIEIIDEKDFIEMLGDGYSQQIDPL